MHFDYIIIICVAGITCIIVMIVSDMMTMFGLMNQRKRISMNGKVASIISKIKNTIHHR